LNTVLPNHGVDPVLRLLQEGGELTRSSASHTNEPLMNSGGIPSAAFSRTVPVNTVITSSVGTRTEWLSGLTTAGSERLGSGLSMNPEAGISQSESSTRINVDPNLRCAELSAE